MRKIKIFISSVQSEFAKERQMLFSYLMQDALLGLFFEPFIFENVPATGQGAIEAYNKEVENCDIYLGIFGKEYGSEDKHGVSPTEHEFNKATESNKTRLIFVSNHSYSERNNKETVLINRAEQEILRKKFSDLSELKTAVYSSLVRYLEEKELIRTGPFDASICATADVSDLEAEKIVRFTTIAKSKRGFPLRPESPVNDILTHLNLTKDDKITNAALLLFGKKTQQYFISSEVKCAQFYGTEISKPIPSYQVYKGDVFQLVDQAVDFVLSRINAQIGTRDRGVDVPVDYEIPQAVVAEAIVNAIAHRDYTSNGSVQVMLFKDRLEIWNPGQLPPNLTLLKLRSSHGSFPSNPLLAEPMYLAGYIERLGTGTRDMIRLCNEKGLKEVEFIQDDVFKTIIWRNVEATGVLTGEVTGEVSGEASGEVSGEASGDVAVEIERVIYVLEDEMKRAEIQKVLQLKHDDYFRMYYILPALDVGVIEMTYPDSPNHPKQKYRLTAKGREIKKHIEKRDK